MLQKQVTGICHVLDSGGHIASYIPASFILYNQVV